MSLSHQTRLEKKCALQSAQLAYLAEICQTLISEAEISHALQKLLLVLPEEMSTAKSAVFVKHPDSGITLLCQSGFHDKELPSLEQFYNHLSLIEEVVTQKKVLNLPSHEIPYVLNELIAQKANVRSGLLVPLLSSSECMGVLFIGLEHNYYIEPEIDHFIQTVGIQIGQSIALNTIYSKMKFSEMRYRTLLESASCSIFVADTKGTILETNRQGEKLLGCSRDEIIGGRFKDYFTPEFRKQLAGWTNELAERKYLEHTAIQIRRKNGDVRTVDGSGSVVEVGNDKLVFMIGTDVTEVNHLRAQSLLNDKLATIGLLAAGVAHEINNPIACILSNLDYINETLLELETDNEKKILIETIKNVVKESTQAGIRVKGIVSDLNAYSRKDDGAIDNVDIKEILDSAISMALPECKNRTVIEKNYNSEIPKLSVNGGKLHQVFLNIIVNAAQSIPEGSPQNNKIRVSTMKQTDKIIISIEDTGKGIAPEALPRIFDPFFTTKPVGQGTGLGLFICHEIVKSMNGELKVDSKVNQGTVFTIELPFNENQR